MKRAILFLSIIILSITGCVKENLFDNSVSGATYYIATTGTGTVTWNDILLKPTLFPPTAHTHTWDQITDKPQEMALIDAINALGYLPVPSKTTVEINAMVMPVNVYAIVRDKTLGVTKQWNGTTWQILITNQ